MTLTALLLLVPTFQAAPEETLAVGDVAPAIQVAEWVKGEPVTAFRPGQTYVVEFWATWCGPCKTSIPHLSELQKTYGDKVRFVGVSVWEEDSARVAPFVQQMGDQMGYAVARDLVSTDAQGDDGWMALHWMKAAKQSGIPAAFIVDGTGHIAWIGHPMRMDEPLAKVVAGKWDLAAAKAEQAAQAASDEAMAKLGAALQGDDWAAIVAIVDETAQRAPKSLVQLGSWKFLAQLQLGKLEDAYGFAATLVDGAVKDEPQALNQIAWTIVDPDASWARRDLSLALRAAERANQLTSESDFSILDTLALVHFDLGHVQQALELQKKAVGLLSETDPNRPDLEERLKQYEEAAKHTQG
jgi:thiol-disulfide isomerase/thioredoxin